MSELPSVSLEFIIEKLSSSDLIVPNSRIDIGESMTTFLRIGKQPIFKRLVTVRSVGGEVNFMQATSLAISFRFMGDLLDWYKMHKNWDEGGYFV